MKIFLNLTKIEDVWKLAKIEYFSNFGKNWRCFKIWSKLKIFENLTKIEDFSNFVRNWRFLKFWSNLIIIIQILDKIEEIWTFHKNLKIFQILELKIFENLVKIEDFSNFGQNWRFLKTWKMSELKKKRFLCWDLNTPVIWSPIQVLMRLNAA